MRLRQQTRPRMISSRGQTRLLLADEAIGNGGGKNYLPVFIRPPMKNIVSATASAMSRKQPESEEILYNLQHRQGARSTRLKHTSVCARKLLGTSGLGGDEKGTRYYQNSLSHYMLHKTLFPVGNTRYPPILTTFASVALRRQYTQT